MAYKSKKLNKRRYFKSYSRKRMYGGEPPQMSDVSKKPTLSSNLGKAGNLLVDYGNNVVSKGIDYVGDAIGYNPDKPPSENIYNASTKMKNLTKVLSDPEFQSEASNVLKNVVKISKPAAEETLNTMNDLVKKEMPILTDMGEKFVLGLPGVGTAVAAGEEVIDAAAAAATAASTLAELSETGSKILVDLNEQKSNVESIIDRSKEVLSDVYNNLNKEAGDVIDAGKEQVDKYNEEVNKYNPEVNKSITKRMMEDKGEELEDYKKQKIDGSLKNAQKEKMMIGGRISQSQSEFLGSNVNRSRFVSQSGGKWRTKRRNFVKRRLSSRSYK